MSRKQSPITPAPLWMTRVLWFAAVYNLAWGAVAILIPNQLFALAGMELPNYPSLARCIGMIVGVYGIGYGIAAKDPVTHWPIVLVGLMGKLFGPIGFVWAASQGEFPWVAGVTILTNDLAWWLPFLAILVYAAKEHDARRLGAQIGSLTEELQAATLEDGRNLYDRSQQQRLLLVFVRHSGCTFCREMLADLKQQLPQIRAANVEPVVIQMGTVTEGRQLLNQHGLTDVAVVSDPARRLYRRCELPLGTLSQLAGLSVIWRALTGGAFFRYGIGKMVGNGLQLAGACLIDHGQLTHAYRHQTAAERVNLTEVACGLPA
jgi:peroxiredoxin